MLKNTVEKYGSVAKSFHWLLAIMIITLLAVGLWMQGLPLSPQKLQIYSIHKATGMVVLGLVILRFLWKIINVSPKMPTHMKMHEKLLAHATHYLFYGLMFLMPISGWLMSSAANFPPTFYGLFTFPNLIAPNQELLGVFKAMHALGGYLFILLIGLHIAGALFHHIYYKDTILRRMLPWGKV